MSWRASPARQNPICHGRCEQWNVTVWFGLSVVSAVASNRKWCMSGWNWICRSPHCAKRAALQTAGSNTRRTSMRAMQIIEWGKPLEARDYPDPEPQGEEVLLRVEAAGVCHSDVHIWDGHFDLGEGKQISLASRGVQLPFTMGHEIAGEVAALGPQASGVEIGDKVVAYPWIGCGQCAACQKGEELLCLRPRTLGTRVAGGYGTHVLVPHRRYLLP